MPALHRTKTLVWLALAWMAIWGAFGATLSIVVGIVDPPSIDPGEGPIDLARTLGGVGAICGALFGLLLAFFERQRTLREVLVLRALLWGLVAGVALPLLTPMNDVLATNTGPLGLFAAGISVWIARARGSRSRPEAPEVTP